MRNRFAGLSLRRAFSETPWWVWALLAPAFAIRFAVAWAPVDTSFVISVPDDAYYYFTIARNIASGSGVTADGLTSTNGFHPLWMLFLVPLWWIAEEGGPTLGVHLALSLGAVFEFLTVLGIARLGAHVVRDRVLAGLLVLGYAWNPYHIASSVNGLETSLTGVLLVWSLAVYMRLRGLEEGVWRDWLIVGLLWALLFLARTDSVFIIGFCLAGLVTCGGGRWRYVAALVPGALLCVAWLLWNLANFGTVVQVSGRAYPYYLHAIWEGQGHNLRDWLLREAGMAVEVARAFGFLSGFSWVLILAAGAAGLVTAGGFARRRDREDRAMWASGLGWPTLGAAAALLYHGLVRWMLVPWYFVPGSLLAVLWLGLVLDLLTGRGRRWVPVLGGGYVVLQLVLGLGLWRKGGMWVAQGEAVTAQRPLSRELCERYRTIGISDSGYWGYYLPCRVVNLDGVVNNAAFQAIAEGRFREYLDEAGIEYAALNEIVSSVVELREGKVPKTPPFAPGSEAGGPG